MQDDSLLRAEAAVLSTPVLIFLGLLVLAAIAFIAAFALETESIRQLQQAGFAPWPLSPSWAGLGDFLNISETPQESIWLQDIPNQKLTVAFAFIPLQQACFCAACVVIAAFCLAAHLSMQTTSQLHPKHGLLIAAAIAACFAGSTFFRVTPYKFTFDLDNRTLIGTPATNTMPITTPMNIFTHVHFGSHNSRTTYLYAENSAGTVFTLAEGGYRIGNLAGPIASFLSANGYGD